MPNTYNNTVGGYFSPTADKSQLTSATFGYIDPVLGIPLNTAADFLWALLIEVRKQNVILASGLNVLEPLAAYDTDPGIVPQSTGTPPSFS
jgi:hypothetical protein